MCSFPRTDLLSLYQKVDSTLRALGLQDVANNIIGNPLQRGISSGQKRRVTIACSVIARPRILVLDEPTSGLDSGSAREVMLASKHRFISFVNMIISDTSLVKRLSQETSMICIATIHQPNWEVFSLFDRLILLAGGRVMYNGSSGELLVHVICARCSYLILPQPRSMNISLKSSARHRDTPTLRTRPSQSLVPIFRIQPLAYLSRSTWTAWLPCGKGSSQSIA